jgi:lysozyme family protein
MSALETAARAPYPALFMEAVTRVLANEGGYARLASDPGGATNFGISQRDYPHLAVESLTRESAVAIYFRDFWKAGRFGELPAPIAVKLFDLSVNMGPAHAAQCLQRALRACAITVADDGALGNATIAGATRAHPEALLAALRSEAAGYYRAASQRAGAKGGAEFLAGWLRRAYQ